MQVNRAVSTPKTAAGFVVHEVAAPVTVQVKVPEGCVVP